MTDRETNIERLKEIRSRIVLVVSGKQTKDEFILDDIDALVFAIGMIVEDKHIVEIWDTIRKHGVDLQPPREDVDWWVAEVSIDLIYADAIKYRLDIHTEGDTAVEAMGNLIDQMACPTFEDNRIAHSELSRKE